MSLNKDVSELKKSIKNGPRKIRPLSMILKKEYETRLFKMFNLFFCTMKNKIFFNKNFNYLKFIIHKQLLNK